MARGKIKVKTVPVQIPEVLLGDLKQAAVEQGQTFSAFAVDSMKARMQHIKIKKQEAENGNTDI